ncbi:MAG: ATP-binding protein [Anaerolineales bacterium]
MPERPHLPVRVRLTLWYVLLSGLLLGGFGLFQYLQTRQALLESVDTALEVAVSQALGSVDTENGAPAFQATEQFPLASRLMLQSDFAVRLLRADGREIERLGDASFPSEPLLTPGFATFGPPGEAWRVYTRPLLDAQGQTQGWIQAAQSLEAVNQTLARLATRFLLMLPVALLLMGVVGVFLADRALQPIDRITRTAAAISAGTLARRIGYQGADDELGRLARTFDQMLDRLEDFFRREQRFVSDAAHELRTPLTVLKGQMEVTLSRPRKPAEYQRVLQALLEQVDRLIRLSNALLFLSRADQQQVDWQPAHLNLSDVLTSILEQLQPLADERRLTVQAEIPPALPVWGDTDHLTRLFLNLLDNAIKYTPAGGQIQVQAERSAAALPIRIHNSGPGLPSETLPHLFDRFYRADASRDRTAGGAGLGLAIAREIVLLHKGDIRAKSAPGEGVTFFVTLPVSEGK